MQWTRFGGRRPPNPVMAYPSISGFETEHFEHCIIIIIIIKLYDCSS
jgi:hypothetical protein